MTTQENTIQFTAKAIIVDGKEVQASRPLLGDVLKVKLFGTAKAA